MLDQPLPVSSDLSTGSVDNSVVEDPVVVSSCSENAGGSSLASSHQPGPNFFTSRSSVHNALGSSTAECLIYLWKSFILQDLSGEAS